MAFQSARSKAEPFFISGTYRNRLQITKAAKVALHWINSQIMYSCHPHTSSMQLHVNNITLAVMLQKAQSALIKLIVLTMTSVPVEEEFGEVTTCFKIALY